MSVYLQPVNTEAKAIAQILVFYANEARKLYLNSNEVIRITEVDFSSYVADYSNLQNTTEEAVKENGQTLPYRFKREPITIYNRDYSSCPFEQEAMERDISEILREIKVRYTRKIRLEDALKNFGKVKKIRIEIPKVNFPMFRRDLLFIPANPHQKILRKKPIPIETDFFAITFHLHRLSKFLQPRIVAVFKFVEEDLF